MKKTIPSEVKRGQAISFRIPSDTPDHILRHLQKLKESERRNFSSKIAEFVVQGVGNSYKRERETITIPLPHKLSKSQRDWVKHEHSEALLGSIIYHLLTDPIRATALLASLNSNSLEINEALYLQEDKAIKDETLTAFNEDKLSIPNEIANSDDLEDMMDDDLSSFDWEETQNQKQEAEEESDEIENDLEGLLGDFLAKMNK